MKQRIRNAFNSAVYRNYDTMVDDVAAELDCRGHDANVIPLLDYLLTSE